MKQLIITAQNKKLVFIAHTLAIFYVFVKEARNLGT